MSKKKAKVEEPAEEPNVGTILPNAGVLKIEDVVPPEVFESQAEDIFVSLPLSMVADTPYSDEVFFANLPEGFVVPRKSDYLGDVFFQLTHYRTAPEQVLWLRQNAGPALSYLLRVAFCPGVEWLIPTGLPPIYKAWKGRRYSAPSELRQELKRLYLFLNGGNDAIGEVKRQKLFQEVIEGLEATELAVLVAVKDHTLEATFGLTKGLVNIAFPGLLDAPFTPKFIR